MRILHIAPHIGGGVKTVLLSWIRRDKINTHTFACFGYSDDEVISVCESNNIMLYSHIEFDTILTLIPQYDIILIHYWNYPHLIHFLTSCELPECRLIFWCHISGLYIPYVIPYEVIRISDRFVLTSSVSYAVNTIKELPESELNKIKTIWSTGGTEKYSNVSRKEHNNINILYAGTIDYAKLSHNFISLCMDINKEIPNTRFIVCGSGASLQILKDQVKDKGISDIFNIVGYVSDLTPYLEISDIFLYPLSRTHFGTAEQILGEVMTCGIVPIVNNNYTERIIIRDRENGIIFDDTDSCIKAIKTLITDSNYYNSLSRAAKIYAMNIYSLPHMMSQWNDLFNDLVTTNKSNKKWKYLKSEYEQTDDIGFNTFIESLGNDGFIFSEYIKYKNMIEAKLNSNLQWKSDAKGSINHYLSYFKDSSILTDINQMVKG